MNKKIILTCLLTLPVYFGVQAQSFLRDISQTSFVPKGQWIVGSNVSYSEYSAKDYNFLIVESISGLGHSINVSPVIAYAFVDNMAAGGRFSYKRNLLKLDEADIVINDETQFNAGDVYRLSHSYTGMAILRNYISLGASKRFALFNETQLQLGGSQSKIVTGSGADLSGTYEKGLDVGISVSPGLVAFVNNIMAVEVNVGVLGFTYSHTEQITNQVEVGERKSNAASFKINLLSVGLGIAFYL